MRHLFSFIFYIKRSKADKNGKANIYLRITVNGKRAELSISRKVDVQKWSSSAGKMKGSSGEAQQLNKYIDSIANRIYKIHQRLVEENKLITAINIRNIYQGKNEVRKMTLEIFENHNIQMEKLVGKDYALGTSERYKTAKKHLKNYINHEYKIEDIPVTEIDNKFITGFEYYLKTEKNCAHNTTIKYITNFKKIVRIAYANDWIVKDPFFNWKGILKTVEREFLDEEEIQRLIEKEFSIHRLNLVKDIFVFSCFTGLAYGDVKALNKDNIVIGIDGGRWIKTTRKKTKTKSNIPLLPSAEIILKKYEEDSDVLNSNKLLPILSNQKMNAYLKEIADICEINKNLTFHLARHTFATSVTLTNGVPIETVSQLLGHSRISTTQIYVKVIERKVSEDMRLLKRKLIIQ